MKQKSAIRMLTVPPEHFDAIISGEKYLVRLAYPRADQLQSNSRVALHCAGRRHETRVRSVRKYTNATGLISTEPADRLLFEGTTPEELVVDINRKLGKGDIRKLGLVVIEIQ